MEGQFDPPPPSLNASRVKEIRVTLETNAHFADIIFLYTVQFEN